MFAAEENKAVLLKKKQKNKKRAVLSGAPEEADLLGYLGKTEVRV